VLAPHQLRDAQQADRLEDVEADPGRVEAALARMPVQLLDQHPGPRYEQDATDGEHPCQYTPSPIHKPMMSHRVGPAMLVRCGTGHLGRRVRLPWRSPLLRPGAVVVIMNGCCPGIVGGDA
jgi:hypothetical protein